MLAERLKDTEVLVLIRERTHTWHDPRELAAAGASLSGLDFLSRIGRGELPAAR